MKAAIIGGGSVLPEYLALEFQREAFDYIVAADRGLEVLRYMEIQPDVMIGDYDSVSKDVYAYFKMKGIPDHVYLERKDDTDMELALHHILRISREQNKRIQLVVYGATGTRLDHVLANISLLKQGLVRGIEMEIRDRHNRIRLCDGRMELNRDTQYGHYVSLLPLTPVVEGVDLTGFRYGMENGRLIQGNSLGISNVIEAEQATIQFQEGLLLVMESSD